MDTSFCIEALEEVLKHYESPDIFNSDQGLNDLTPDEAYFGRQRYAA
jgi:hypothetical protein